jgi:hypothetical protein
MPRTATVANGLRHDRDTNVAEVRVPSAAPIPRGPSVLLLGSAAALLNAPGCPVCRYAAESNDAYLAWFALEGHGDTDMLGRLRASRGMCARHTRQLLAQPGAATRLTAVYRYVVAAAAEDIGAAAAGCPACEHEAASRSETIRYLGLARAVMVGSEPQAGSDLVSRFLDSVTPT